MAKKGSKKNHPQNTRYKQSNIRERNKLRNLKRHVSKFPKDVQAQRSLVLIEQGGKGKSGKQKYVKMVKDDPALKKGNMYYAFRAEISRLKQFKAQGAMEVRKLRQFA